VGNPYLLTLLGVTTPVVTRPKRGNYYLDMALKRGIKLKVTTTF
jgi:hypothetical protein